MNHISTGNLNMEEGVIWYMPICLLSGSDTKHTPHTSTSLTAVLSPKGILGIIVGDRELEQASHLPKTTISRILWKSHGR